MANLQLAFELRNETVDKAALRDLLIKAEQLGAKFAIVDTPFGAWGLLSSLGVLNPVSTPEQVEVLRIPETVDAEVTETPPAPDEASTWASQMFGGAAPSADAQDFLNSNSGATRHLAPTPQLAVTKRRGGRPTNEERAARAAAAAAESALTVVQSPVVSQLASAVSQLAPVVSQLAPLVSQPEPAPVVSQPVPPPSATAPVPGAAIPPGWSQPETAPVASASVMTKEQFIEGIRACTRYDGNRGMRETFAYVKEAGHTHLESVPPEQWAPMLAGIRTRLGMAA